MLDMFCPFRAHISSKLVKNYELCIMNYTFFNLFVIFLLCYLVKCMVGIFEI